MDRPSTSTPPGLRDPRRLVLAGCPAWLLLLAGCAQLMPSPLTTPAVVRAQADGPKSARLSAPVVSQLPEEQAPAPHPAPANGSAALPETLSSKALPISLDTVLRLAQDQNGQVAIARAKLDEAFAQRAVAAKAWLPDLWVGTSYYRHEGGIQDFQGNLIHSSFGSLFGGAELRGRFDLREAAFQKIDAERKIWQQKGELSRLTSENLLDASSTYVDLLSARASEAIVLGLGKELQDLLGRAEKLARFVPAVEVEVDRIRDQLTDQEQKIRQLREGARKAAAKLLYLLGLDPAADLVVVERHMVAFQLVDPGTPVEQLVQQAIAAGPGVRELEGLLNLIHQSAEKSQGLGKYLPVFDVRAGEGIFGAGPGSNSTWDNRFDIALQARWNLTPLVTARERKMVAQAKMQQVHLSMNDLKAKLTMGVQEAYESVQSGQEQFALAQKRILDAREAYNRSLWRLQNVKGTTPSEVLMTIGMMGQAQMNYLQAVRDYDKAQLRLLVLLGLGSDRCHQ
jgi:outer membrane protein TolC